MKVPGPVIAVLLIIVILFCAVSGLGLEGSLNGFTFDSAQTMMSSDLFSGLRPRVGVEDIAATIPPCLRTRGTGEAERLAAIVLNGGNCTFTINPSADEVRSLPLHFETGEAEVSFDPAPTATPENPPDEPPIGGGDAVRIEDRVVNATERDLSIAVPKRGGSVIVECSGACRLGVGDPTPTPTRTP